MSPNRFLCGILVGLGVMAVTPRARAFDANGTRPDLEVRRPVLDPAIARVGSPSRPIFRSGIAAKLFDGKLAGTPLDAVTRRQLDLDLAPAGIVSSLLRARSLRAFPDGRSFADYVQTYRGLEIVDSQVDVQFRNGRRVLTTEVVFPSVSVSTTPAVTGAHAEQAALDSLAAAGVTGLTLSKTSELVVYPQERADGSITYRLAWRNFVRSASPIGNWMTVVAADGTDEVLARHNRVAFAVGQFQVQVEPRYIGQTPVTVAAPGHTVGNGAVTDGDGIWETASGALTVPNAGSFFSLADQAANTRTKQITVNGSGFEQFTWASTEAPLEELDPFYYAHISHERQSNFSAPDVSWFYQVLPINTNVSGTCNAYYDGQSLNFFPTGGGCNATSRIADVIFHEYGHGIHDHLAPNGIDQASSEIQEGVADIFAHEITNDPNLGPYFIPNQQAGIRNAEDVRTYPSGVQGNNAEVHESGKIWTNTFWLLRKEYIRKMGMTLGSHAFDLMHADTLRGGPQYTTAYQATIAADDDDGNPANGTPNSCEINQIFTDHGLLMGTAAATRGFLVLHHTPPTPAAGSFQAANSDIPVSVSIDSMSPSCGDVDTSSVTLHYTVNGGAEQTVTLSGAGPFDGAIPGQAEGSVVSYWFTAAETAQGALFTAPLGAPKNAYTLYVGALNTVFTDDFESDKGWTHGADVASHDDWELGTPAGLWFDPAAAHSGTGAIGNDLGVRGGNGLYESNVSNWLESPAVDCSACKGARLQFWRSLDIAPGDSATVKVNDQVVWTSETDGRLDDGWTFVDLDIGSIADGQSSLKIRFELTTDGQVQHSGWTLDDVSVMAEQGGTPPGNPPPGNGETGLSDSLNGGCRCAVAPASAPGAGTFFAGMLGLVALGAVLSRRRDEA